MIWLNWKQIKKGKYIYAKIPEHPSATINGYVLEHRIVMENKLNRLLSKTEIVHHIDKNTKNNTEVNLQLMDEQDHRENHGKEYNKRITCVCDQCGIQFELKGNKYRYRQKLYKNIFCSHHCRAIYRGFGTLIRPYK